MDFFDCITGRRSCRSFLSDPVDKKNLENILQAANRSPSYMNSQPWEVFVLTGDLKQIVAQDLSEQAVEQKPPSPDLAFPKEWPDSEARRIEDHRLRRFKALGIDPNDGEAVREHFLRNFKFFEAPCVLIVGLDKGLSPWSLFDLGSFVHGVLLAARSEGLGACPQAVPLSYPAVVRRHLEIPDYIQLILSIALGYPEQEAAVNQYRSTRRDIHDFIHWHGFQG